VAEAMRTVTIPLTVTGVLRAMKRLSKADQIDVYARIPNLYRED
jgi:hypothetical protein